MRTSKVQTNSPGVGVTSAQVSNPHSLSHISMVERAADNRLTEVRFLVGQPVSSVSVTGTVYLPSSKVGVCGFDSHR